ncbi:fluoride efflux transporter CrcB [Candidatus Dependentiae bacterium]|nr:fluoride efflux transporter CrcB [Candidatus Dependentiae bacterium]
MFKDIFTLMLGGIFGTFLRYEISYVLFERVFKFLTPWPTLIVNVMGAFLIGLLYEICIISSCSLLFKKFLIIGFLGAFTTFSTYSLEVINLIRTGEIQKALIYIILSNFLSLATVFIGILFTRKIIYYS